MTNEVFGCIRRIFFPDYISRIESLVQSNRKFVQYTSAEAASRIISNREIWLRNTRCMNDFSEVEHGIKCLIYALRNTEEGKGFEAVLDKIFPDLFKELFVLFEEWLPLFRTGTFIMCVSEHLETENKYGRLSMWRAYGKGQSVAIVLNPKPFLSDSNALKAYTSPVFYMEPEDFNIEIENLSRRIDENAEFLTEIGRDLFRSSLFSFFRSATLCTKHPGFKEELEWRVFYNPKMESSQYILKEIRSIEGVPQEIFKIPLYNIPEHGFYGAEVPELVEKIIIGPNDHQAVLANTFAELLRDAGCDDADERIRFSGIPLR